VKDYCVRCGTGEVEGVCIALSPKYRLCSRLHAAEPSPASFPSFAKIVAELHQRVTASPSSRSMPSTTTSATN